MLKHIFNFLKVLSHYKIITKIYRKTNANYFNHYCINQIESKRMPLY